MPFLAVEDASEATSNAEKAPKKEIGRIEAEKEVLSLIQPFINVAGDSGDYSEVKEQPRNRAGAKICLGCRRPLDQHSVRDRITRCPFSGLLWHHSCWKIWKARGFPKGKEFILEI